MQDQTPITWVDGSTTLDDDSFNTEIRNAYALLLSPPICQVHRAAAASVATGGFNPITWDTKNFDTEDPSTPMYSAGNPTRITIQTAGYYYVNAAVGVGNTDTNTQNASIAVRVNNSTYYNLDTSRGPANRSLYLAASTIIPFSASDYLELMISQTSGTAGNLAVTAYLPLFTVVRWAGL